MKRISYFFAVVSLGLFLLIPALALPSFALTTAVTTCSFEAVTEAPWEWDNFSVAWTDNNQDGLFQLDELEPGGFSGVTYLTFGRFYDTIEAVPVWSTESPYTGGTEAEWSFSGYMGSITADPSSWSYNGSGPVTPLPSSVLLLGSGLLGLGFLGWRRRKY